MSKSLIQAYWQPASRTLLCEVEGVVDIPLLGTANGFLQTQLSVLNVIWDFRAADASGIRIPDLQQMADILREERHPRLRGKVVYLVSSGAQHDKVARFVFIDNLERAGLQNAQIFSTDNKAIDWLGIKGMPSRHYASFSAEKKGSL